MYAQTARERKKEKYNCNVRALERIFPLLIDCFSTKCWIFFLSDLNVVAYGVINICELTQIIKVRPPSSGNGKIEMANINTVLASIKHTQAVTIIVQ